MILVSLSPPMSQLKLVSKDKNALRPYTEWDTITPKKALHILEANQNFKNRSISKFKVTLYTRDLESSEGWINNHCGIAFTVDGTLIDGYHRLHAIVKANKSAYMSISYNLPLELFDVVDTGRRRSGSDSLKIDGCLHSTHAAACTRLLYMYQHCPTESWSGLHNQISNSKIRQYYKKYKKEMDQGYSLAKGIYQYSKVLPLSIALTNYVLAVKVGWDDLVIAPFFEKIYIGTDLSRTDPCLSFRSQLVKKIYKAKGGNYRRFLLNATIKCFNLYVNESEVKHFKPPHHDKPLEKIADHNSVLFGDIGENGENNE